MTEPQSDAVLDSRDPAIVSEPHADELNPREQLRADAVALIIASRRMGLNVQGVIHEAEESIKD